MIVFIQVAESPETSSHLPSRPCCPLWCLVSFVFLVSSEFITGEMTTLRPFRCTDMFHFSNVYVTFLPCCLFYSNRRFSTTMLVDENKRSPITFFCSSTRSRTFLYCYWCPQRLVENVLYG